jgi:hypothetical protein
MPSAKLLQGCMMATKSKKKIPDQYDSDSYLLAIDNCCSITTAITAGSLKINLLLTLRLVNPDRDSPSVLLTIIARTPMPKNSSVT